MRIVGGSAGGRALAVPAGDTTRPTSDRVREAVFGRLDAWGAVLDARVLDLYAGSGALGLEALSRGARSALAVESDRAAHRVAQTNADRLGLALSVRKDTVQRVLANLAKVGEQFDLVLLDPPYALAEEALASVLEGVADCCAPGAVVVVERSARSLEPTWPDGLPVIDSRGYGDTTVWFAETPVAS